MLSTPQFTGMLIKQFTASTEGARFKTSIEVIPSGKIGIDDDEVVLNNESIGRSKALKKISDALAKGELEAGELVSTVVKTPHKTKVLDERMVANETLQRRLLGIIQNLVTTPETYDKLFSGMKGAEDQTAMSPVELYHTFKTRFRETITQGQMKIRQNDTESVKFTLS